MPGYRVEYASSGRAKCNGRKPCKGTAIGKGQIRFGTWVTVHENGAFKWRHWGCLTSSVLKNVSEELEGKISELDGFEELEVGDQEKIKKAFEEGRVDPDDVPPTAVPEKSAAEEEDDKAPKKRKRAPAKKKPKANSPQPLDESASADRPEEEEADEKPAKKKRARSIKKKPPPSSD